MGGVYCEDCDIAATPTDEAATTGVRTYATDPEAAARLWTVSGGADRRERVRGGVIPA